MNTQLAIDIGANFDSPFGDTKTLGDLISLILSASITVASIIMLFLFVIGGFKIITSAGNDDPQSAAQGKQAITYAIIGFVVVITAFLVIRVIEIITETTFLTAPF